MLLGLVIWLAPGTSLSQEDAHEGLADMEEFDGAEAAVGEEELTELNPVDDEDDEKYRGMEEILVTARRGTQNLQDVGASVAAFDADYLEALGAQNIADISQFTPNLEIRTVFAASNPTLFIRGVGLRDFNANSSSAVAVYNDDIYMNSPAGQLGQLFDVQQVEVLRGPQGTLYGRNASAGAIRVITRKPSGDTNGYAKFTYGKFNEIEAEGAMEVPITDTVSVRISGRMRKRDGYTKNRCADPQFNNSDGSGDLNFQNSVHGQCFNDSTTAVEEIAPGPANSYWDSVTGQLIETDTPNPLTGANTFPYYGKNVGEAGAQLLPWYYRFQVINGVLLPTAVENPELGLCGVGLGCQYLIDPASDPIYSIVSVPQPYYSPGWQPGATPTTIPLWTNNVDNWAARMLLRWQPSESVDWVLNVHGGMNRGDARQFQTVAAKQLTTSPYPSFDILGDREGYWDSDLQTYPGPGDPPLGVYTPATRPEDGDPYAGDYNTDGMEKLDLYGASVTGEFNFGGDAFLFRTITGFEGNSRTLDADLDASPFPIGIEPTLGNDAWQFTQEVKLNWEDDEAWSVEVGATYLYEDLEVDSLWSTITQQYTTKTNYASVYAWLDWHPVDDFAITAGGRWNFESKEMHLRTEIYFPNIITGLLHEVPIVPGASASEKISANGPSGDITFSYRPSDDRLFFLKYSRGYKGPHINGGVLNARQKTEDFSNLTSPVDPEKVDALEFGIKTAWFDNQLTINGAVFYYDYQDIQIFQLRNSAGAFPVNQLINAEDADIYGAELEIRTHPLYGFVPESFDGLEIFLSFGYLHSTYTEFINVIASIDDQGNETVLVEDNSGNTLINSPEFAFSGYLSWPLRSDFGTLTPRVDWSYKSEVFFSARNFDFIGQEPLWLLNLRIGYMNPGGNIELAGWIRNVGDTVYRGDVINLARFYNSILYAMGEPRTYGATLNVRF